MWSNTCVVLLSCILPTTSSNTCQKACAFYNGGSICNTAMTNLVQIPCLLRCAIKQGSMYISESVACKHNCLVTAHTSMPQQDWQLYNVHCTGSDLQGCCVKPAILLASTIPLLRCQQCRFANDGIYKPIIHSLLSRHEEITICTCIAKESVTCCHACVAHICRHSMQHTQPQCKQIAN